METATRKRPIHLGDHVRRMRTALGVKQSALASELGTTQQNISRIEQEEDVDEGTLERIGKVLGVSAEAIRNFDEEAAINIVSNSFTSQDSSTINAINVQPTFNPVDRVVELYERLLQVEREKNELLEKIIKSQSSE